MYQALSSISGDDKIFGATRESTLSYLTPFWNRDAREVGATTESPEPHLHYRWWDGDARQAGTTKESIMSYLRYRWWDGDAREAGTTPESTAPYLRYRWGDGDARQAGATPESTVPNLRYRWGNDCIHTSSYKCIALRVNDGIAILA